MVFPEFPGRECPKLVSASRECADVRFKVGKYVSSVRVSHWIMSRHCQGIVTYFQSILLLILLKVWPQISQSKGIPSNTSFGVGGTLKLVVSISARLETNEEWDAIVAA